MLNLSYLQLQIKVLKILRSTILTFEIGNTGTSERMLFNTLPTSFKISEFELSRVLNAAGTIIPIKIIHDTVIQEIIKVIECI